MPSRLLMLGISRKGVTKTRERRGRGAQVTTMEVAVVVRVEGGKFPVRESLEITSKVGSKCGVTIRTYSEYELRVRKA